MKPIDIIAIILTGIIGFNYTIIIVAPLITGVPRTEFQMQGTKEVTLALITLLGTYVGYQIAKKSKDGKGEG